MYVGNQTKVVDDSTFLLFQRRMNFELWQEGFNDICINVFGLPTFVRGGYVGGKDIFPVVLNQKPVFYGYPKPFRLLLILL